MCEIGKLLVGKKLGVVSGNSPYGFEYCPFVTKRDYSRHEKGFVLYVTYDMEAGREIVVGTVGIARLGGKHRIASQQSARMAEHLNVP